MPRKLSVVPYTEICILVTISEEAFCSLFIFFPVWCCCCHGNRSWSCFVIQCKGLPDREVCCSSSSTHSLHPVSCVTAFANHGPLLPGIIVNTHDFDTHTYDTDTRTAIHGSLGNTVCVTSWGNHILGRADHRCPPTEGWPRDQGKLWRFVQWYRRGARQEVQGVSVETASSFDVETWRVAVTVAYKSLEASNQNASLGSLQVVRRPRQMWIISLGVWWCVWFAVWALRWEWGGWKAPWTLAALRFLTFQLLVLPALVLRIERGTGKVCAKCLFLPLVVSPSALALQGTSQAWELVGNADSRAEMTDRVCTSGSGQRSVITQVSGPCCVWERLVSGMFLGVVSPGTGLRTVLVAMSGLSVIPLLEFTQLTVRRILNKVVWGIPKLLT